jgi:hypothetical protein
LAARARDDKDRLATESNTQGERTLDSEDDDDDKDGTREDDDDEKMKWTKDNNDETDEG